VRLSCAALLLCRDLQLKTFVQLCYFHSRDDTPRRCRFQGRCILGKNYFLSDTMNELACACSAAPSRIMPRRCSFCDCLTASHVPLLLLLLSHGVAGVSRSLAALTSRARSSGSSRISLEDAFTFTAAPLNLSSKSQVNGSTVSSGMHASGSARI